MKKIVFAVVMVSLFIAFFHRPGNVAPFPIATAPGEYVNGYVSGGNFYEIIGTLSGNGFPQLKAGLPQGHITAAFGGPHDMYVLTDSGTVWAWGNNYVGEDGNGTTTGSSTPTELRDSATHNIIYNIVQISAGGIGGPGEPWFALFLQNNGSSTQLWGAGQLNYGAEGNGTNGNPSAVYAVPINFPAGVVLKKVSAGIVCWALDQNDSLWDWAGNAIGGGISGHDQGCAMAQGTSTPVWSTPTLLTNIGNVKDFSSPGYFCFVITNDNHLYGATPYTGYLPIGVQGQAWNTYPCSNNWVKLDSVLPAAESGNTMTAVNCNDVMTYLQFSDSSMWTCGDAITGADGTGFAANFPWMTYSNGAFNWTQGRGSLPLQKFTQIAPGVKFITCFPGHDESYNAQFLIVNPFSGGLALATTGRNKTANAANNIISAHYTAGNIGGSYPNSWDVHWLTIIYPQAWISESGAIQVSSPYCILSANYTNSSACQTYPQPTQTPKPNVSAGPDETTTGTSYMIYGSSSGNSTYQMDTVHWYQISGPNTAVLPIVTSDTLWATNLIPGIYRFVHTGTDQNYGTASDTMTLTVNTSNVPPNVSIAPVSQQVTLPQTSATLTGSASGNGGATIVSYAWTQVTGPVGATILSPTSATTQVSVFVPGNYTFKLTVTDSNGLTNFATATVSLNCSCLIEKFTILQPKP